jgi:heptosyltransferase I
VTSSSLEQTTIGSSLAEPPDALCIIRLSAIGDCCHTLAVVRSIQSAWPNTKITWIIGRTEYELMKGIRDIEFIIFDKSKGLSSLLELRRTLAGRRFPVLLHLHASMRANLVSLCVSADIRLGYDRARATDHQWLFTNQRIRHQSQQHVLDAMYSFIEYFGVPRGEPRWDLAIPSGDRDFAHQHCADSKQVCVISPCSSQRFRNYRNWSAENYISLATYIHENFGAKIILTGGPSEIETYFGRAIETGTDFPIVNLIGATTLKQLVALIEAADLVICPDSGPAHMATAVGTKIIGLYATSNPQRTGPYLCQDLVANRYPDAIRQASGKSVDDVRWGQRVRSPEAMSLISLDDVTSKVDLILG